MIMSSKELSQHEVCDIVREIMKLTPQEAGILQVYLGWLKKHLPEINAGKITDPLKAFKAECVLGE